MNESKKGSINEGMKTLGAERMREREEGEAEERALRAAFLEAGGRVDL